MPLFTVTMRSGRTAADKDAISAAIHAASVSAGWRTPTSASARAIPIWRNPAIVTRLEAAGTDPNDVMVFVGELDRLNSSFSGGRPALPVEVRP